MVAAETRNEGQDGGSRDKECGTGWWQLRQGVGDRMVAAKTRNEGHDCGS